MQYNLKNKKVLITGASGGIGRALCDKFIENGCILLCTSSNSTKLDKLKSELGSNHFYYKLDLLDVAQISQTVNLISEEHKDINILINNAAATTDNLFLRMKEVQWNEVVNINLNSNFYIIKGILPLMIKNRIGCIIGISSVVAMTGNPGQANYAATKSAMISMYKSIALEVAQRNIRVNIIAPGFIKTPMTDKNKFPMPMIKSPEYAAQKIFSGLVKKNVFEIHFPIAFTFMSKLLKIMPNWLYFLIVGKGIKMKIIRS